MGNKQSVRASHFQRPGEVPTKSLDDTDDDHRISISNKMVERLVEDATLLSGTEPKTSNPREDYKDLIYMEKLKCMDENHSERFGITVDKMNALVTRVDVRTSNMVSGEPVCAHIKKKIIECYNSASHTDVFKCWDAIGAFTQCVQDAGTKRLQERSERDAREKERRSRHVALARSHALKDLTPGENPFK